MAKHAPNNKHEQKESAPFSHLDADNRPGMVDVSSKKLSRREAVASGFVPLPASAIVSMGNGKDLDSPKGPVFQSAILAGTMAVKNTSGMIPLCHPLPIDKISFDLSLEEEGVRVRCRVSAEWRTGVEMEALTGVSVAALTICDMCKSVSHDIVIESVKLEEKTGGKSGYRSKAKGAVEPPPLVGLVLAGGESRRMGCDKSFLEYHGKPQAEYLCDQIRPFCSNVFISAREGQFSSAAFPDVEIIRDRIIGFGPVGGILSAMEKHPDRAWLVVACDMPYLDGQTIKKLVGSRNPEKPFSASVNPDNNLPEPLCAIYEPSARDLLWNSIRDGRHCPRKILMEQGFHRVSFSSAKRFSNINTPEEDQEVRQWMKRK